MFGRRWGKTVGMTEILLELGIERPGLQIGWFAHRYSACKVAWEHALKVTPPTAIRRKHSGEMDLQINNGSRFKCWSLEDPESCLGWGYDFAVIDEGARVSQYARDEIVWPMTLDRGGTLLVPTTPKGRKGRGGWVYRDYKKAKEGVAHYAYVQGPTTENPNPLIQEWVEFYRENMPAAAYEQEILAQFLDTGAGILDLEPICTQGGSAESPVKLPFEDEYAEKWGDVKNGEEWIPEPCVAGVDLAQKVNWSVVWIIGLKSKRTRFVDRFSRLPWQAQRERIARACRKWRAGCFIDATGIGSVVSEELRGLLGGSQLPGHSVRLVPVVLSSDVKTEVIQGLQVATERKEFSMPWVAEAVSESETFEAEPLPSGRMRYSAPSGFDDDTIIALALANRGIHRTIRGVIR